MCYAHFPIRKFVLGFGLLIFSGAACNQASAMLQEGSPAELIELIESDQDGPVSEIEVEDPVKIPPAAALVTDQVDPVEQIEGAELSDIVGDLIARDRNESAAVVQDASVNADEIARGKRTSVDAKDQATDAGSDNAAGSETAGVIARRETPSEDDDDAAVAATDALSGTTPVLTPEHVSWLWKGIYVALFIGFLLWLLSLMTHKNDDEERSTASSGSGKPNNNARSGAATGAAAGAAKINKADIGKVHARRPEVVDDLTKIGGIDAAEAKRLNEAGIWQYDQLRSMNAQQRANLQRELNLPRIRWYSISGLSSSTAKATVDSPATNAAGASVGGSDKLRVDSGSTATADSSELNVQGTSVPPPKFRDDLTRLPGVDAKLAAQFNEDGIYNIKQIQSFSPAQKLAFEKRFGVSFDKLNVAQFASGSTVGAGQGGSGSLTSSSSADVGGLGASGVAAVAGLVSSDRSNGSVTSADPSAGDHSGARDSHGHVDDTIGFVYKAKPSDADDLTKLDGIDAEAAKRLNDAGIYKFEQLENLSEQQTEHLVKRFNLSGANAADWKRCFYAWGRGIDTSAEVKQVLENGVLNGVELPQIADAVFDGEKLTGYDEQVVFRGSNPEGWGTGHHGIEGVEASIGCDTIRSDINFLRIRRCDTQESVVVPMTKGLIFSNGDPAISGWNGASEMFFGGRHVGAFAQHLPQEVETKYSQGGWGFGHRYDHNDRQEWGWAGRVIQPTTMEVSVGCIGKMPGTIVFRSSDPSIWNTETKDGDSRFAMPIESVQHPVNFVRIMRQITGEAVIVRVDGNHLLDEGFDPRLGWNGSGTEFFGGRHLGAYHTDLPQDFETRHEFGGWGFGHPYHENDRQAWGWGGRQLPETVFEISLLESVPEYMKHEVLS